MEEPEAEAALVDVAVEAPSGVAVEVADAASPAGEAVELAGAAIEDPTGATAVDLALDHAALALASAVLGTPTGRELKASTAAALEAPEVVFPAVAHSAVVFPAVAPPAFPAVTVRQELCKYESVNETRPLLFDNGRT